MTDEADETGDESADAPDAAGEANDAERADTAGEGDATEGADAADDESLPDPETLTDRVDAAAASLEDAAMEADPDAVEADFGGIETRDDSDGRRRTEHLLPVTSVGQI